MKEISIKELIKRSFLAIVKPHKAFRQIPRRKKINRKEISLLTFIWGAIFTILNGAFIQRTLIFQWNHWSVTLIAQAIFGFLIWFAGSIFFFILARILKKKVSLNKIEIGVFYIWTVWAIMPFFDLPHFLFDISIWNIFRAGAHLSWLFAFPFFSILTFFFLKDVLHFKKRELVFATFFSVFLPFFGRFFLEEIPSFLNSFLKIFNQPAGYANCAFLSAFIVLMFFLLLKKALFKQISFRKFVFSFSKLTIIAILIWVGFVYFTPWKNISTGGKTSYFYNNEIYNKNFFGKGISRHTNSQTWTSSDYETGSIIHPPTGAANDDSSSYWTDKAGYLDQVDLSFSPSEVYIKEIRVKVTFNTNTVNWQSGVGPKAQGCFAANVTGAGTFYCSAWTENLSGASTQTFTINSSNIRTYVASGDGAAATSTDWDNLVAAITQNDNDVYVHSWTQGDGNASSDTGDSIGFAAVVVEIDYYRDITQRAYIFENDDGANVNSNSNIASANTALTDVLKGERFTARIQLDNTTGTDAGNETFKLQYDKNGDGQWTDVQMAGSPSSNSGGNFGEWEVNTVSGASEPASVGRFSSVAVPADGKPVISFYDATGGDLAVCKCNDASCISTPTCNYDVDATNDVGKFTSIAIGADGYPVVAHVDDTNDRIRVCDCADASCSSASCNTLNNVPAAYSSAVDYNSIDIAVDSSGYPWVSFNDTTSDSDLEVCHCNDAACAGQNETCTAVHTANISGAYSSIALDTSGNPIVAFSYLTTYYSLGVAKYVGSGGTGCAGGVTDWTCTTGIDDGGRGASLALLSDGTPVISHHTDTGSGWGASLEYCKCGNISCSSGNSCGQIKDIGNYGNVTSLSVGKDGLPVIANYNYDNADLYFYKCNDNSCTGGDEFYQKIDSSSSVGKEASIIIGSDDWPTISYYDETNTNLKTAKMLPNAEIQATWGLSGSNGDSLTSAEAGACYGSTTWQNGAWYEGTSTSGTINLATSKCTELSFAVDTSRATVGTQYRLRLVYGDNKVFDTYSQYPTFTIVSEANNIKRYSKESVLMSGSGCDSSDYSCNYDYTTGTVGMESSIAIGDDGNPVIAFQSGSNLAVCKCKDSYCVETPTCSTVDSGSSYGNWTSIAIGTDGNPIISHQDAGLNLDLRVCKCNDPACSGGDETCTALNSALQAVDSYGTSIAIGADGLPVISCLLGTTSNHDLYVFKCGNASCTSGNTSTAVDTTNDAGGFSSIAIGNDSYPVVSHFESSGGNLRFCKCGNAACSSGNSCTTVETFGSYNYGTGTSIAVGTDGLPIMALQDEANDDLRVCKCGDASCSSGNTCTAVDAHASNDYGQYNSIAIGTNGNPIVSHHDATNNDLRVCTCGDISCSSGNSCSAIDSTNTIGAEQTSVAIGNDGSPVISYYDSSGGDLEIAKKVGLPLTASSFFNRFVKTDKQIKFKSNTLSSQFLESWGMNKDGLRYWFDDAGYDDVTTDDSDMDNLTSSSSEAPVYTFVDQHSSSVNNIYATWIGQSTVAASTNNIKLEIYNWNTDSWETLTTNSSCAANTDCIVEGSKTSNLSYYYFPRYNYDSTKQEKSTTPEYYTYFRVYQATGSQTLKSDYWGIEYSVAGITVSGNVYENETSTALDACDGSTAMISLRVGSTTYGPVSCNDSTGAFSFSGVTQPATGDPMVVWIDGQTPKASTVNRYDGSGDSTGLELRRDRLMIMSESGNVTNTNLDLYDSGNDSDIIYSVSSSNLTLASGYKLVINTSDTYEPGGTVTTTAALVQASTAGDILIQSSATMSVGTNAVSCGGDWTNSGTFTKSSGQTTTFTGTTTGFQISPNSSNFANVTFNGSGGGWSFSATTTIDEDLTMTAGILSGTSSVNVNGGDVTGNGDINLTGGTFLVDGESTTGFGGDTDWDFYNLTFGDGSGTTTTTKTGSGNITTTSVMTIAANQTLNAGDDTWTLSGAGTPFVKTGTFTPSTSTFVYTGSSATNVASVTYYTLNIGASQAGVTYAAQGSITANNNVNLQSASSGTNTLAMGVNDLTSGSTSVTNSGGIAVPANSAITQSSSATTTVKSSSGGAATIGGAGSTQFYNFTEGTASDNLSYTFTLGGPITVSNDLTNTAGGTGTHTLDVSSSDYGITVGGSWTNNSTFTRQQGTVTFNAGTTGKIIADGGSPFYNILFNGSGGEWLYQNGASIAPNQTTVQAGTPTFLNAKKGTVSVTGGTLNSDWYIGAHLVDAMTTTNDINTDTCSDVTISENSGMPQSTVWRYNGGWGSSATSQTTGTGVACNGPSNGISAQPNNTGAIRVREYSMTSSSTCPGAGCTLYKYNMKVNWQPSYGEYDYYDGYGDNYLTSCWAGSSTVCNDDTTDDDAVGENWYRSTPSAVNGSKPYDGLDEPPDQYGTWYAGMIIGLDVTISDDTIEFGEIEPGTSPTNQTNNITVATGAADGYTIYTWSNQPMTFGTSDIADWSGTNEIPTTWSSGEGFGYSTDDITLVGPGDQNRFSGPKYAGFGHVGPGLPVADRTEPTLSSAGQNTISYRLGTSSTQTAGPYASTVIFDVVPQY